MSDLAIVAVFVSFALSTVAVCAIVFGRSFTGHAKDREISMGVGGPPTPEPTRKGRL